MTERRDDRNEARLDQERLRALYRQAEDVEPEAGLDRMIRARAAEAAGRTRAHRRIPWLGGLATASVAIVAIAVVLQQAPPEGFAPEVPLETEAFDSETLMAPSVGADSTVESSVETQRARSQMREMRSAEAQEFEAAPPPSATALGAPAPALPERQRAERLGDIVAEQVAEFAEPAAPKSRETTEDPDTMLSHVEALLEVGEIQRARESLEALKRRYPDHAIPEEVEAALRKDSGDDPK